MDFSVDGEIETMMIGPGPTITEATINQFS